MTQQIDPITLAVVSGALQSTVRQMTLTMERTARSPIFKLAHDYSNAIFDWVPRMAIQGEDLPIHLGSLIHATKSVAGYFSGDVRPGDVMYHNDPSSGGGHLQDMCMFKPVFFEGELVFWAANKAHMDDTGGSVPGGYNPTAEEIYAEGLRIPPLKLYDAGRMRRDVMDLIVANVRTKRQQRSDMQAQLAAVQIAERNVLRLLDRYGKETVKGCIEEIMRMGEVNMRKFIAGLPDGTYEGSALVEYDGGGSGDLLIRCLITVRGDEMTIAFDSPPQVRSYINSYFANTISSIYYAVLTYANLPYPHNEGMYLPLHLDLGPPGTLTNAKDPAPCSAATTTVGDNITDAVRDCLAKVVPDRAIAGWCHCAGTNMIGTNPRTGEHYNFNMIIGTGGGAGAVTGMDGWPCLNTTAGAGGILTGDIEMLEHEYPVIIHRYELRTDSACAGKWRGGLAPVFEVEPLGEEGTLVLWGEGVKNTAACLHGALQPHPEKKVVKKYLLSDGEVRELPHPSMVPIRRGERLRTCPAGGGAIGDPFERDVEAVSRDVENELVSLACSRSEYGVALDPATFEVDREETRRLRGARAR